MSYMHEEWVKILFVIIEIL